MDQDFIPRDISPLTHFLRFDERSEQGEGDLVICDVVCQFYHDCGHVSTRTSCHNLQNIQLLQDASQNYNPPPHHIYPCSEILCNQVAVAKFYRYVQGSCPDCGRNGLGSSVELNPPFNGATVIRSDPHLPHVPANVVASRRGTYRVLAMQSLFQIVGIMLDGSSSYLEEVTVIAASDDLFVPYDQQFDPGALSNRLERNLFDSWLYHRACEEDRRQIPPVLRGYYVRTQEQHTPLLSIVASTDDGVAGEQCMICRDPEYLLEQGDPRRLPCGHIFHWDCITGWIYQPMTNTCPYCRQEYFITDLPRISPM